MQFKKLLLFFIPLFIVNATLPMWRQAAMAQTRNLGSRAARTTALLTHARRPTTRLITQRTITPTPIRKRVFNSQRAQNRASWFDWSKWKKNACAVGTAVFGVGIGWAYNNTITFHKVENLLQQNAFETSLQKTDKIEMFIENLTEDQFNQFIAIIISNFNKLTNMSFFGNMVSIILSYEPEAAKQFAQPAIDNITQIRPSIVYDILSYEPQATKQFVQPAIDNITQISPRMIYYIIKHDPEVAQQFVQPALDNIDSIHPDLLVVLPIESNAKTKAALTQLEQKESDDLDTFFKILILSKKICKQQHCRTKCCTQTYHHLRNNIDSNIDSFGCSFSRLFEMANKVNQKEKELQQDYYTFVHGQRWGYQFAEHLFTKLYEWTNKKECPEFLFAHMKKLPKYLDEENIHEELLTKGRTTAESRQRLLFLNYAFFGNSSNLGSSTAYYIANNRNVGTIKIGLQELFEWNNLEQIYQKYKSQLIKLQREHNSLSRFGNLLMVAVPKDIVDKCIFPASLGGYKKKMEKKGWVWNSKIDKTSDILEAIKEDAITNSDEIEFCLAMTRAEHGGLNEDSGIKFFDINGVDEEKWKAYKEKEEALLEKIKADILASQAENKEVAIT